jgi:hypothetical protein
MGGHPQPRPHPPAPSPDGRGGAGGRGVLAYRMLKHTVNKVLSLRDCAPPPKEGAGEWLLLTLSS